MSRDRTGVAVDALDRVCVAYNGQAQIGLGFQNQLIARVMKFDGTNVTYLTPSFFPFISADTTNSFATGIMGFVSNNPHVAMTTEAICIAAKATVNSTNNPYGGPDSGLETTVYAVISHPAPVAPPRPQMMVTKSGNNAIIAWDADAGLFTLQSRPALGSGSWAAVSPQPATVLDSLPNLNEMTVAIGSGPVFFRLAR